jgi:gliding motility-associated-like protein
MQKIYYIYLVKKHYFLLFTSLILGMRIVNAQQNLVPNYSFEQKIKCINDFDDFTGYVADWSGQSEPGGGGLSWITAQCNSFGYAGVPNNEWGYQYAHTGNSYAGIITYLSQYDICPICSNYRNYIQVELTYPLISGTKYCVVFYVSLSDTSKYSCSNMGVYFSDSALFDNPNGTVKSNFTPQINNDPINNPLFDKVNWIKISGSFIAVGGEQYIIIGNFENDNSSYVDSVGSTASNSMVDALGAYYYIDDVSVLEVMQAHAGRDTLICNGNKTLTGKDTAIPGVSYRWSPTTGLSNPNAPQTFASPTVTTTYTLTVINDSMEVKSCGCPDSLTKDSVTVNVYNIPVTVCCSSTITNGQSVMLTASPAYKYVWFPNTGLNNDTGLSVTASPTITTTYTVMGIDSTGCIARDSLTIIVNPETCGEVFIPTAFSPNQSVNNILFVRGECISAMDFRIFDRWGNRVFESQNQSKGWDGTSNGKPLAMGVYVWELTATLQDGTSIDKKGNVTLVR